MAEHLFGRHAEVGRPESASHRSTRRPPKAAGRCPRACPPSGGPGMTAEVDVPDDHDLQVLRLHCRGGTRSSLAPINRNGDSITKPTRKGGATRTTKKAPAKMAPPTEATAVVEGSPTTRPVSDPVAAMRRDLLGTINPAQVFRPAPNDSAPAEARNSQMLWEHATTRAADGTSQWDEAYGNVRLSILTGVRVGTVVPIPNRNHGTEMADGIGGVKRVDQLAGGMVVGFTVEADPISAGADEVRIAGLSRAVTLWTVRPGGEIGAVEFGPATGPVAVGIKNLAPVGGSPRSQVLWLAKVNEYASAEAIQRLAAVEASLANQTATTAEVGAEPLKVTQA